LSRIEEDQSSEFPRAAAGTKVLVAGASGGIGSAVVDSLLGSRNCLVGAHGSSKSCGQSGQNLIKIQKKLESAESCEELVAQFCDQAGRLDSLVVLVGGMSAPMRLPDITHEAWAHDIHLNLSIPFFLAQAAMRRMLDQGSGGRIILTGTESSLHGGGAESLAYGVAKQGTECLVKGLARAGAGDGVLVNGIRLGFIASGFHERWQAKTPDDLEERARLVPLKRAGTPQEVAALINYLLSDWSKFITGQMISLAGGDWL
jgi:3-oxoacyl-[acyl-carrier protein] reductase